MIPAPDPTLRRTVLILRAVLAERLRRRPSATPLQRRQTHQYAVGFLDALNLVEQQLDDGRSWTFDAFAQAAKRRATPRLRPVE